MCIQVLRLSDTLKKNKVNVFDMTQAGRTVNFIPTEELQIYYCDENFAALSKFCFAWKIKAILKCDSSGIKFCK